MTASRIARLVLALDADGERAPRHAIASLLRLGRLARLALRDALRTSESARVRRWAVDALGQSRDRTMLPDIRRALRDPSMSVRLHAVGAIGRYQSPRVGRALLPLLKDPSGGIRVNVVDTIARLRVTGCNRALMTLTGDAKWYVRLAAVRALAARSALSPALRRRLAADPHAAVRNAARERPERVRRRDSRAAV